MINARKWGAVFLGHGPTSHALVAYEAEILPATSRIVLTNRGAGPDSILDVAAERSGGQFDDIEDVISKQEMAEHGKKYKAIAGFGITETIAKPRTIAQGARYNGR